MSLRALGVLGITLVTGCGEYADSCFAGSTRIATPRGPRPIRELAIGDEVWSYDHVERRFAIGKITALHRARGAIRSIRTAAGVLAAVTDSHPLFVATRGEFVAASAIAVGEPLLHWAGDPESRPARSDVLGFGSPAPGDTVEVFNLTVGDAYPTFFADGFFVHNKQTSLRSCTATSPVTVSAPTEICVGWRFDVALSRSCVATEDLKARTVLATSDHTVLATEGMTATALGVGTATLIVLVDGEKVGETSLVVTSCELDAGVH